MITILILTEKLSTNEKIAASIIGGFSGGITVVSTTEAEEAESVYLSEKQTVDVFILQVNMQKQSGFKIAESIRQTEKYRKTPILFITPLSYNMVGFHPLATYRSYEKHNFIAAPVERLDVQGKLGLYLDKILETRGSGTEDRVVFLEHDRGQTFVAVSEILYAEVCRKQVTLYCREDCYMFKRMSLCELEKMIGDERLLRCHKSFAVNIKVVTAIREDGRRNWKAVLETGRECPVSQTFYSEFRRKFIENRGGK